MNLVVMMMKVYSTHLVHSYGLVNVNSYYVKEMETGLMCKKFQDVKAIV